MHICTSWCVYSTLMLWTFEYIRVSCPTAGGAARWSATPSVQCSFKDTGMNSGKPGKKSAWALMTSQQRKWVGLDYNCQTTTHMHDRSWRDYNRRCLLYYNFFPVTNNNTVSLVLWNYFSETRFTSTKFCNQKVKDQRNKMFIVHR